MGHNYKNTCNVTLSSAWRIEMVLMRWRSRNDSSWEMRKHWGRTFWNMSLCTYTYTRVHMAALLHKQAPQSASVRECEHEIGNEKDIDLRMYSAEILASPSLPINIIIANGLHGQMLLTLISCGFYPHNHYSLLTGWIESVCEQYHHNSFVQIYSAFKALCKPLTSLHMLCDIIAAKHSCNLSVVVSIKQPQKELSGTFISPDILNNIHPQCYHQNIR